MDSAERLSLSGSMAMKTCNFSQEGNMDRPDWIKCIRHTHEEMKTTSWCGRYIPRSEWYFVDIDHVAYNAMKAGRLVVCDECADTVIQHLTKYRFES